MCLASLARLWERVQVELHGQYSVAHFEALGEYQARHTSSQRALAIAVLGPLPLLLLLISTDALPLVPISEGLYKQSFAFWLRICLIGWLTPFTLVYQTCIVAPMLPMSRIRLLVITSVSAAGTCTLAVAFILLIGFPVPFAIEFESGPFLLMLGTALWLSWKDTLRTNPLARLSLKRYLNVLGVQIIMVQIYIGFNLAFNQLHGFHQTLLSGLLPLIKLFFKNCINKGTFHLEDLSPIVVVFSVDVFHSLFVSLTMQQASSNGANVVVMIVDVVQTCVAFYELSRVLTRFHALVEQDEKYSSLKSRDRGSESGLRLTVSVIDYAAYVLTTNEKVRNHPRIALPRQSRGSDAPISVFAPQRKNRERRASACSVSPLTQDLHGQPQPGGPCLTDQDTWRLSQHSLRHVECTKCVLKLLHMVEFYVLVEYVEAMLSVSYTQYMLVLSYLPSRQFYSQLSHLSSSQLRVTAWHVGVFAAAEVLSLVLFCMVVDRKIKHFSTLQQLAFALETNGKLIYAVTVGWVFMIVQLSLEHFGSDYTIQFRWLRQSLPSSTLGS